MGFCQEASWRFVLGILGQQDAAIGCVAGQGQMPEICPYLFVHASATMIIF